MALCSLLATVLLLLGTAADRAPLPPAMPVSVTIYFGPQARPTIEKAVEMEAGATAMDAVHRAARVETNAEGTFLVSIEGVANSSARKEFWLYFVNGEPMHVSAAQKRLEPRDRVLWFLRKSGSSSHTSH